ncbi:MAG: hypothetical protein VX363_00300 [Pseudomonadota bacterium]|nr:hypothetical protein [Pseudomonadota bacterium]
MANVIRLILPLLVTMLLCVSTAISAADTSYRKLLLKDLDDYLVCWQNQNYRCMATYVVPRVVEELGGVEGFIKTMESVPALFEAQGMRLDVSSMNMGVPSPLAEYKDVLISVVPTRIPLTINGENAVLNGSIVALSENQGQRWYYIDGTTEGLQFLASTFGDELFRFIVVPKNTIELNGQLVALD